MNANGLVRSALYRTAHAIFFSAVVFTGFAFANTSTAQSTQRYVVGSVDGSAEVGADGQLSYTVPIEVPPGIGAVKPSVQIGYRSSGANGMLGLGGVLAGFSAITRCGRNMATHGEVRGISYNTTDRYCFDGQVLIAVQGEYGADGTVYRTEIDSRQRIISRGSIAHPNGNAAGPEYFAVTGADGTRHLFGRDANSRDTLTNSDVPHTWWIRKTIDQNANTMVFSYQKLLEAGPDGLQYSEHLPSSIVYGGNSRADTDVADLKVTLKWESRPDKSYGFEKFHQYQSTRRLARVQTSAGGAMVRDYRVLYGTSQKSRMSRMSAILECAGNGACLAPTKFKWNNPGQQWTRSSPGLPHRLITNSGLELGELVDINNDGYVDSLLAHRTPGGQNRLQTSLGGPDGFTVASQWRLPTPLFNNGVEADRSVSTARLVDINSDGLIDVVEAWRASGQNVIRTWLNNGNGWTEAPDWALPKWFVALGNGVSVEDTMLLDVNGDARPDLVGSTQRVNGQVLTGVWLNNGAGFTQDDSFKVPFTIVAYPSANKPEQLGEFVDLNGDGLVDWLAATRSADGSTNLAAYLNNGRKFRLVTGLTPPVVMRNYRRNEDGLPVGQLADINGDGYPDIVRSYQTGDQLTAQTYLNLGGRGWLASTAYRTPVALVTVGGGTYRHRGEIMDITGDGLADLVVGEYQQDGSMVRRVMRNTGTGFEFYNQANLPSWLFRHTGDGKSRATGALIDINGDGFADFVDAYSQYAWIAGDGSAEKPEAVRKVINGFGVRHDIEYAPLTNPNMHVSKTGGVYPNVFVPPSGQAVSRMVVDTGETIPGNNSGRKSTSHRYGPRSTNLIGRGSRGFAWRQAVTRADANGYMSVRTNYAQDWPLTGRTTLIKKSWIENDQATLLFRSEINYETLSLDNGLTVYPVETSREATGWDLDGSEKSRVTSSTVFDAMGNAVETTATTSDEQGDYVSTTRVTVRDDVNRWILGLPEFTRTVKTGPIGDPVVATVRKSFDGYGRLVSTTANEADPLHTVTHLEYDTFGNVIKTSIAPGGDLAAARVVTVRPSPNGRFPRVTTNQAGHVTKTYWSKQHAGKKILVVDRNNQRTEWLYDAFGRQLREHQVRGPQPKDGNKNIVIMHWCKTGDAEQDAKNQCPDSAVYFAGALDNEGEAPESVYYDMFSREVRKQTVGFDGRMVFVDTHYDLYGNKVFKSQPYFAEPPSRGEAADWEATKDDGTTFQYDVLGRVVSATNAIGATTRTRYSGRTTTVVDVNSREAVSVVNGQGKVISATDAGGNVTRFEHDAAGRLIRTVDSRGNEFVTVYDLSGRKVASNDPDLGAWTYTYGAFGELASQMDAKGQVTTLEYDSLGRMTRRVEQESFTRWRYDDAEGRGGRLTAVLQKTHAGELLYRRAYEYDGYARPTATVVTIDGVAHTTRQSYDGTTDRPLSKTFPSGMTATTLYNDYGHPRSVYTGGSGRLGLYTDARAKAVRLETAAMDLQAEKNDEYERYAALAGEEDDRVAAYWNSIKHIEPDMLAYQQVQTDVTNWFNAKDAQFRSRIGINSHLRAWVEWFFPAQQKADEEFSEWQDANRPDFPRPSANENSQQPGDAERLVIWQQYDRDKAAKRAQLFGVLDQQGAILERMDNLIGIETILDQLSRAVKAYEQYNIASHEPKIKKYTAMVAVRDGWVEKATAIRDAVQAAVDTANAAADAAEASLDDFRQRASLHWTGVKIAADGQPVRARLGDVPDEGKPDYRLNVFWAYDKLGRLTAIRVNKKGFNLVEDALVYQTYRYNEDGTLDARREHVTKVDERFDYDELNRLVESTLEGMGTNSYREARNYATDDLLTTTYTYDELGNIESKSDVGTYAYGDGAGPHAVTSITNADGVFPMRYDANGNMITGRGRNIEWSSFNKPTRIAANGSTTNLVYGPDRQLIKTTRTGASEETITYLPGYEIRKGPSELDPAKTVTYQRHYLTVGKYPVAVIRTGAGEGKRVNYMHRDHLNSLVAVSNNEGDIIKRFHYDAFGAPREGLGVDSEQMTQKLASVTTRGYTGHIMLKGTGLIHMGGRVYDPTLGRFLSADPHVQFPQYSQSLNRYSYLMNNPLTATDPTGFFLKKLFKGILKLFDKVMKLIGKIMRKVGNFLKKYGRQIAALAVMALAPYLSTFVSPVLAGAITGGLSGFISTGSLKGMFIGALAGAAVGAIGQAMPSPSGPMMKLKKAMLHGFVGGARSKLSGGSFSKSFLSTGFSNLVSPLTYSIKGDGLVGRLKRIVTAGVIGGSASALIGGRFKQGFTSAAFAQAFNGELSRLQQAKNIASKAGKAAMNWLKSPKTVMLGAEGTAALGAGYTVEGGFYFYQEGWKVDFGMYDSHGPAVGADIAAAAVITGLRVSPSTFQGSSVSGNIHLGPGTVGVLLSEDFSVQGWKLGLGTPAVAPIPMIGVTGTHEHTEFYSLPNGLWRAAGAFGEFMRQ